MFEKEESSSIIAFINSVIRIGKEDDYQSLLDDAIEEICIRVPLIGKTYKIQAL